VTRTGQLGSDDLVRSNDACDWQPMRKVIAPQPFLLDPHRSAKDAGFRGEAAGKESLADRCYYQLASWREHRPFTSASIQDLIGSSGQTAEQVLGASRRPTRVDFLLCASGHAAMARSRNGSLMQARHHARRSLKPAY
jgi:hypothetical protein